jgi:hypothetical protein
MSTGFRAGVVFTLIVTIISYTWMYFTHVPTQVYIRTEFNFSIISDMDQASRIPNEPVWQSYLKVKKITINFKNGTIRYNITTGNYTIELTNSTTLKSQFSRKFRGMV